MHPILKALKSEIEMTLFFLCDVDLEIYGHITPETVRCFEVQRRPFPEVLKPLVKP